MVRGLSNTSELGLTCSCSLTSPPAVSESYLSVSDAQLLRLLALGVTGAVCFVDGVERVVCMWVTGLGWFEFTCVGDSLEPCVIVRLLGGGILGGRYALSVSPIASSIQYILVRRRVMNRDVIVWALCCCLAS